MCSHSSRDTFDLGRGPFFKPMVDRRLAGGKCSILDCSFDSSRSDTRGRSILDYASLLLEQSSRSEGAIHCRFCQFTYICRPIDDACSSRLSHEVKLEWLSMVRTYDFPRRISSSCSSRQFNCKPCFFHFHDGHSACNHICSAGTFGSASLTSIRSIGSGTDAMVLGFYCGGYTCDCGFLHSLYPVQDSSNHFGAIIGSVCGCARCGGLPLCSMAVGAVLPDSLVEAFSRYFIYARGNQAEFREIIRTWRKV